MKTINFVAVKTIRIYFGEIEAPISLVEVHPTHERLEMTVVYLNR